jgi:hypothetical protein
MVLDLLALVRGLDLRRRLSSSCSYHLKNMKVFFTSVTLVSENYGEVICFYSLAGHLAY